MVKIAKQLTDLIGRTPLLELERYGKKHNLNAKLIAKIEAFNPGGSVKDRIAYAMIEDVEQRGVLKQGATIIEPTSGNTGVGLAWVSSIKGYKLILTMPDTMSIERINLLKALGAEIELTPGVGGMNGAIARAKQLQDEIEGSVILQQFENKANVAAHIYTTAKEIWDDTDGKVDIFVGGVGSAGTVSGTGAGLKRYNSEIKVVAVEPAGSPVLEGGIPAPHIIQGIGAGFVPGIYNREVVDKVIAVQDNEAVKAGRELAKLEGLLVGISSGAAVAAATKLAEMPENAGKMIVVLLPDTGERYLSTVLYDFENYPV